MEKSLLLFLFMVACLWFVSPARRVRAPVQFAAPAARWICKRRFAATKSWKFRYHRARMRVRCAVLNHFLQGECCCTPVLLCFHRGTCKQSTTQQHESIPPELLMRGGAPRRSVRPSAALGLNKSQKASERTWADVASAGRVQWRNDDWQEMAWEPTPEDWGTADQAKVNIVLEQRLEEESVTQMNCHFAGGEPLVAEFPATSMAGFNLEWYGAFASTMTVPDWEPKRNRRSKSKLLPVTRRKWFYASTLMRTTRLAKSGGQRWEGSQAVMSHHAC